MNIEKRISPGLCRCCGGLTVHRTLTETYRHMHGEKEIYSDMIKYCFGIQFSGIDGTCKAQSKVICGPCVLKLRDAFAFKKQIEENEENFLRQNGIPKALNVLQASWQITPIENKPEPCRECELRKAEVEEDQSKLIKDTSDKNIQTEDLIIMCELESNDVNLGKPNILRRKPRKATLVPRIITIDEYDNRANSSELLTLPTSTSSKITKRTPAYQRKPRKSDNLDLANRIAVDEYQSDANNLELNPPFAISESILQVENETPDIEGIFIVKKETLQTEMDMEAVDVLKQETDITKEEIMPSEERVEIKEEVEEGMIVETLDGDSEDDGNDIDDENDIENDENVIYDDDYEDDTPTANAELIINNSYAVPFRKTISRVRCYYCDKYIPDHKLLREHILEHSPEEFKHSGDKFIRIDIKRINCRQCDRKIEDLASLGRHLYKTHGERYMCIARSGVIPYVLDNSSQCVVCGDKYTSFLDLDDHMQKHFTDHVCECDNDTGDPADLKKARNASNKSSEEPRRISLRPRHSIASYVPPNTSFNDSLDITDDEKNWDDSTLIRDTVPITSSGICDNDNHVPPGNTNERNLTNNVTITRQSLLQDHNMQIQDTVPATSSRIADSNIPDIPSDNRSDFDDSDRHETYNAASEDSSSVTSYIEERDQLNDTHRNRQLNLRLRRLEKPSDLTTSNNEYSTNDNGKKLKRVRMKDYCYFCELDVLNFARHILRNHSTETEVQKIISYPKKSFTRKNLLTVLRKRGNYIKNVVKCDKPMKKSSLPVDYLPCEKCLGFYSRKQLWKHKKICQPLSRTANTQVQAQNFMLRNLNIDKKLKEEVFPKMRPDKISLQAKRDMLICTFGAQYLRINRDKKNLVNVTSRKMRELAKLVLELKMLKPSLNNLMDCLKSQNYDLIVTATKKVSSYDDTTDRYGAPTYAINIGTSLKQCCHIAIMNTLKSGSSVQTATKEADLKTLIHRIEANWKFDVYSQAAHLKKCSKITIVPLAKDLQLLNNYLCEKSKSAATKLRESGTNNIDAYNTLSETVYCRVLLLNRRRAGLQRLPLSIYQETNNDNSAYEEFDRATSGAEKMLVKSFKHIVIRGKRGRGVPVLLTDEVQNDIDLLISVRRNYIVYMDETSLQAHLSAINSSSNACQICHKSYKDAATLCAHDRRTHEEAEISDWSAENVSCSNDVVSDPPESDEEFYRKKKKPKKKTNKPISQTHFSDLEDDAGLEDLWDQHFKHSDQNNGHFEEISGEKIRGKTLIKSKNNNENLSKQCGENVAEINGQNLEKIKGRNFGETSGKNLYENSSYPEKQSKCLPRRKSYATEIRKSERPRKEIDYSHKPRKAEYLMIKKSRKSRYTKRKSVKNVTQKSNCDNVIVIE